MATISPSDDTPDIFWPGYVDAVTNLAINLLFVIAVMSIVVLGSNLKIAGLLKLKNQTPAVESQDAPLNGITIAQLEEKIKLTQAHLQQTQAKLAEAEKKLKQKEVSETNESRTEIVSVGAPDATANTDANDIQRMGNGVVVSFATDAVTMSSNEVSALITQLNVLGHVKNSRWQITVISPKGFSETLRLSYYRANAVRNALIENGSPSSAIEMKITESTQANANNTKVFVRLQP